VAGEAATNRPESLAAVERSAQTRESVVRPGLMGTAVAFKVLPYSRRRSQGILKGEVSLYH
jgi:hypothetical protein